MKKIYIIFIIVLVLGVTWFISMHQAPTDSVIIPAPTAQTPVAANPGDNMYTSKTLGFSAQLPQGYTVDESYAYVVNPERSIDGVKFTIPATVAKGTNLSTDSYVSVEKVPGTKSCTADYFLDGKNTASSTVAHGVTYSVAKSSGAGAGNRYDETVYVLPRNDKCIAVRYFVHYTVVQNYDPGTVQEFNSAALMNQFDSIRDSVTTS